MRSRTSRLLSAMMLVTLCALPTPSVADAHGPTFVADGTPGTGTTGDPFEFRVTVEDPDRLLVVEVRYRYGTGGEVVSPMEPLDGTGRNFSHTTRLPPDERTLNYRFRAQDALSNWNETASTFVIIADNDPPELLSDTTARFAQPGRPLVFEAEVSDNIGVSAAWVLWRADGGAEQNLSLSDTHPMRAEVLVPVTGVSRLEYRFEAIDPVGNSLRSDARTVEVVEDPTPPEFGRDSSPALGGTGEEYTFAIEVTDDQGLEEVRVAYRLGTADAANRSLGGDHVFTLTIQLPLDAVGMLNYTFFAADVAGNTARTAQRSVPVVDVILPVAVAGPDILARPRDTFSLDASASNDNIGIVAYAWSYEAGGRTYRFNEPAPRVEITGEGTYTIRLVVRDAADNEGHDELNVTVRKDAPPQGPAVPEPRVREEAWTLPAAVAIAAGVTAAYLAARRLRRRGRPRRGRGSRSTSSRSQVGYSSTK